MICIQHDVFFGLGITLRQNLYQNVEKNKPVTTVYSELYRTIHILKFMREKNYMLNEKIIKN